MIHSTSITDFNLLSSDEKAWNIWHGATFLHVYEKDQFRINLFYLNQFYIELWYHMDENRIEKVFAFTNPEMLDPFLDNISLGIKVTE